MLKIKTGRDVFNAGIDRIYQVFKEGHRPVFAFSAGKDSGVLIELALIAAHAAGKLPIDVMFRDDEILYPGTAEYAERIAARPEINFHWIVNRQPATNIYNRELPFYWCFDPLLEPDQWVRQYPEYAEIDLENINLYYIVNTRKFPNPKGKKLVSVVGIRTEESSNRALAIKSTKGPRAYAPKDKNMFNLYPIYDWTTGDIWKAIKDNKWDYNEAYDVLTKMGVPKNKQRLSQIAMSPIGADSLQIAAKAWPKWFDKVSERLPGIRSVANFGTRVLRPIRHSTETWEECFHRTCTGEKTPRWIFERASYAEHKLLQYHRQHADTPFPEVEPCRVCKSSYKALAEALYCGDPFHIEMAWLPEIEPSLFRPSETRSWPKDHVSIPKNMKDLLGTT